MEIKELDMLAKNGGEMPPCLAPYEQAYYQASRYLYMSFYNGALTLAQCRAEKQRIIEVYNQGKKQWEYFLSLQSIGSKLEELKSQGFNSSVEWEVLEEINKIFES